MQTIQELEKKYGHKIIVKAFDSLYDFHGFMKSNSQKHGISTDDFTPYLPYLIEDYRVNKDKIEKILEEMQQDDLFASGLPMPQANYYGSTPNVARYLAGLPKSMNKRIRSETASLNIPINIFVNINLSGGLDEKTMVTKGIAIAALAISLNATRPVNVYTVKPLSNGALPWIITMVKLNENTLDIGRLDFAMCNIKFHREMAWECPRYICLEDEHIKKQRPYISYFGGWPFNNNIDTEEYNSAVKACVGCTKNDIWVPGSFVYNKNLINNPIKWVKDQINLHKERFEPDQDNLE